MFPYFDHARAVIVSKVRYLGSSLSRRKKREKKNPGFIRGSDLLILYQARRARCARLQSGETIMHSVICSYSLSRVIRFNKEGM